MDNYTQIAGIPATAGKLASLYGTTPLGITHLKFAMLIPDAV